MAAVSVDSGALSAGCFLCPVCEASIAGPAAAFFAHAATCDSDARGSTPFAALAHLFRPRLHSTRDIAAFGEPVDGPVTWPVPPQALAPTTASTRAMVLRGALCYTLRDSDAHTVHTLPDGRAILLGSEAAARSVGAVRRYGVTSIVNCAFNSEPLSEATRADAGVGHYTRLDFRDVPALAGQDNAALIRAGAAAVAEGVASTRGAVLVHCVAGMSRSTSCVAAYLVLHRGLSLADAMTAIRAARPAAQPNAGFWQALCGIEEDTGRGCSVPRAAVAALHAGSRFPLSTHVFGDAERS